MKRTGLILALIVVGLAAWAGWTYATTEGKVSDIASRLPSEEALDSMPLEQTVEALKLAQCSATAWRAFRRTLWPGSCGATRSSLSPSTAS